NSSTICSGGPVTLQDSQYYSGTYQWYINNSPIAGAVSTFYTTDSTGTYYQTLNSDIGCAYVSNNITLVADSIPTVPTITRMQDTLQSSSASGYQWSFNWALISDATNQLYYMTQS